MGIYRRSTRECDVNQLRPELLRATREYFSTHQLGNPETEVLRCCETVSEKKPGNRLTAWLEADADQTVLTGILLTKEALVWGRAGERSGVRVVSAELKYIHARLHFSVFSKEPELEISGLVENGQIHIRGVIALGPEPAAEKFCEEVHEAVEKINPSSTRKWPGWMGGNR